MKIQYEMNDKVWTAFDERAIVIEISENGEYLTLTLESDPSYTIATPAIIIRPRFESLCIKNT